MAVNKVSSVDYDIAKMDGVKKWIDKEIGKTREDWEDGRDFRRKLAHFHGRRHSLLYRDPKKPWVGSSNIVMPLIDKNVTSFMPLYHNAVFGSPNIVKAVPLDEVSYSTALNFELWQNSIYSGVSPRYSMPDFMQQQTLYNSNILTYGQAAWHVYWSKKTRNNARMIRSTNLPGMVADLAIVPDLTNEERMQFIQQEQMAMQQGGLGMATQNPPQLMNAFGGQPVNPINREFFDRNIKIIERIVTTSFELNLGDIQDKKTLQAIVKWLRSGGVGDLIVKYRIVYEETVRCESIHPSDLILPPDAVFNLQRTPRFTLRKFYTDEEILGLARDNDWNIDNVDLAIKHASAKKTFSIEDEIRRSEDVLTQSIRSVNADYEGEFKEYHLMGRIVDIDEDGVPERVMVMVEPSSGIPLSNIQELPYNHGMWPIVRGYFELTTDNYKHARGIGELINDSDIALTAAHRAKVNGWHLSQGRQFFIRKNSSLDREGFTFGPTMVARTENPQSDIRELEPNLSAAIWQEEEQFHQIWVQGHLGNIANDITADKNLTEPRTATEFHFRRSDTERITGMRGALFLESQRQLYQMVASVSQQYAPDSFIAQLTGSDPTELHKEDVQGNFSIFPVAAAGDMDPSYRAQKAMARLQLVASVGPAASNSAVYSVDVAQALKEALDADDIIASKRIMPKRPSEDVIGSLLQMLESARASGNIADASRRAVSNEGITKEEVIMLYQEAIKNMPHKEFTKIIEAGVLTGQSTETAVSGAVQNGM